MTYCSLNGEVDPESLAGNVRGFDPAAVYRTYDEYVNDAERTYIEYFLRDAYEYYGYGFQYYDGQPVDEAKAEELIRNWIKLKRAEEEEISRIPTPVEFQKYYTL